MNKLFLRLVMLPSGMWSGMGANPAHLRAILDTKLKIDDRKPLTFTMRKRTKPMRFASAANVAISFFMGVLYAFPLMFMKDRVIAMALFFSLYMIMLCLMLVTDFSSVMFDTRDKFIIFPRPVNDKTIFLSKVLHIFIYLFRLVIPMALPAWIIIGMKDGWQSALLFPLPVMLLLFTTLFLVNGIYLLILKIAGQHKFSEVINYFQIAFTILIFVISYFLPRLLESNIFQEPNAATLSWMRFLPSYWLAAMWSWIGYPLVLVGTKWTGMLAVAFPLVLIWINTKWLAPQFARKIGALDEVDPGTAKTTVKTSSGRLYKMLAGLLNKRSAAQAGFIITWLQTARSRTFKMRVYPMFAYAPVLFVYMLIGNKRGSVSETWDSLAASNMYLMLLYLCIVSVLQAFNYLSFSDQYKAAWVYYVSPLDKPGTVMIGAFKAIWVKYFLPFFTFISIFILFIWGIGVFPDILLALINMILFSMIMMRIAFRNFPFSIVEQMKNSGNRVVKSLLGMMVPALLGFGHYLAIHVWWLKLIFFILACIMLWLVWDSYTNTSWADMKKSDEE